MTESCAVVLFLEDATAAATRRERKFRICGSCGGWTESCLLA
jgi:hypothetical protein